MNAIHEIIGATIRPFRGIAAWCRRVIFRQRLDSLEEHYQSTGVVVDTTPDDTKEPSTSGATKARRRTQEKPDAETFSDLLDGLDETFRTMKIPQIDERWISKKDVSSLHKLGVFVPSPWLMEYTDDVPELPKDMLLPMIASAFVIGKKYDVEDRVHPRYMFAIKDVRLPPYVEKVRGVPYKFGYCVEMNSLQNDRTSEMRMFWMWAWIVVTPSGAIVAPHELRPVTHTIRHRRTTSNIKTRGARVSYFQTRQWVLPTILRSEREGMQHEYYQTALCLFRQLLLWWTTRDERWSVGVRKDGHRVTFSIDKEHTAAYFADRDRVVAVDGRAKKIIHYVRSHTRANGSLVREHIRGLREFDWRGYHCSVTAPKLYGHIFTDAPLSPVIVDEKNIPDGFLSIEEAAERLADMEDRVVVRRSTATQAPQRQQPEPNTRASQAA